MFWVYLWALKPKTMKKFLALFILLATAFYSHSQTVWMQIDSQTDANLHAVAFSDVEHGVVVGDGGTILRTDDYFTWTVIETAFSQDLRDVAHAGQSIFVAAGAQGLIVRSVDAGLNWDIVQAASQDYDLFGLAIDPVSGNGVAGGSGNTILTTQDHGESWSFYEGGFMNAYYCACMANADFGLVIGSNAVFQSLAAYTNNGGQSFDYQSFYPTSGGTGYEGNTTDCHFFSSEKGFAVGPLWDGQGFITTEVNWDDQFWDATFMPVPLLTIDFFNEERGAIAGFNGYLAETYNGGEDWFQAITGVNDLAINDIEVISISDYRTGFAVGMNGLLLSRETIPGFNEKTIGPLQLVPQPADQYCRFLLPEAGGATVTYTLTDSQGRMLVTQQSKLINAVAGLYEVDTSTLPEGIFMLKAFFKDKIFGGKVVVRR